MQLKRAGGYCKWEASSVLLIHGLNLKEHVSWYATAGSDKFKTVEVGLPGDPGGGNTEKMPVPANLDYDAWLGATPEVYYTEDRVHSHDASTQGIHEQAGMAAL